METPKMEKGVLLLKRTPQLLNPHSGLSDSELDQIARRLRRSGTIVDQRHEGPGHTSRVGVLDDIPAIHDA